MSRECRDALPVALAIGVATRDIEIMFVRWSLDQLGDARDEPLATVRAVPHAIAALEAIDAERQAWLRGETQRALRASRARERTGGARDLAVVIADALASGHLMRAVSRLAMFCTRAPEAEA